MSSPKNIYLELRSNGSIASIPAVKRNMAEIHEIFAVMPGYKKLGKHLIELNVNGSIKKIALLRIVPEGNKDILERKRVQLSKSMFDSLPDAIVAVYTMDDGCVFVSSSSVESLLDLPDNITTLFRLDLRFLRKALLSKVKIENVHSRGKMTTLIASKSIEGIFEQSGSDSLEEKDFLIDSADQYDVFDFEDIIQPEVDPIDLKKIGDFAEEIVWNSLGIDKERMHENLELIIGEKIKEVKWVNEEKEMYMPYDLVVNGNIYIEVKGSINQGSFIYSNNEKTFGDEKTEKYFLIKIDGIELDKKRFESFLIYKHEDLKEMAITPISYNVKEK